MDFSGISDIQQPKIGAAIFYENGTKLQAHSNAAWTGINHFSASQTCKRVFKDCFRGSPAGDGAGALPVTQSSDAKAHCTTSLSSSSAYLTCRARALAFGLCAEDKRWLCSSGKKGPKCHKRLPRFFQVRSTVGL